MNRLTHRGAAAASTLLLLAAAACGGGGGSSDSAQPADDSNSQSTSQSGTRAATTLQTAQSEFGPILVDSRGMTLYMFDPDQGGQSTCDAECLAAWPPVEGPADAGKGVDDSLLGTAKATDGTTIATYNGWPLYYWVKDQQPGDVTGQAVSDVWWVLNPDGKPIRERAQAADGGNAGAAGGGGGGGGGDDDVDAATTIRTASSEFGRILVDSKGMTLYMFDPDQGGNSTCDAECLEAWPPVEGPGAAGKGVDDSLLGVTKATDGTRMVTYNDWPLYYWAQDQRPGEVTGQAVNDVWWVVDANGRPVRQAP